jgi:hypothetical protein
MIQITCARDGFRRCGVAHPRGPVMYEDDYFSEEALKILDADPMLTVTSLDGDAVVPSADFDQMRVPELTELLTRLEIPVPAKAKKADLVELLRTHET